MPDGLVPALFAAKTDMPKFGPPIYDRALLMLLGFDEIQTDTLLVLWEAGGELPLWGDGTSTDLCHELDMTSSSLRQHLKPLEAMRLVKLSSKGRALWVRALSPIETKDQIVGSFGKTSDAMSRFFEHKARECRSIERSVPPPPRPSRAIVTKRVMATLQSLSKEQKTSYGILSGSWNNKELLISDFFPVRCRSGMRIHFMPDWTEYHRTKRHMMSIEEAPMAEFHTHPDGKPTPAPRDIEKMKMLRLGCWAIGASGDVSFYHFYHERSPKLRLVIDQLDLK
jgi:proteasome lid subunit RPN8/RPN11